jgi:DNA-directed RNA polymerase subunit K/omega
VDNDSVAKQMNRGLFLAPDLDNDEDDDPLLEQARENVDDDVAEIEEKREHKNDNEKDRR